MTVRVTIIYEEGAWHIYDLDQAVFTAPFPTEAAARAYLPVLASQGFPCIEQPYPSPAGTDVRLSNSDSSLTVRRVPSPFTADLFASR